MSHPWCGFMVGHLTFPVPGGWRLSLCSITVDQLFFFHSSGKARFNVWADSWLLGDDAGTWLLVSGWGLCRGMFEERQEEVKNWGWSRALYEQLSWSAVRPEKRTSQAICYGLCHDTVVGQGAVCVSCSGASPGVLMLPHLMCFNVGSCLVLAPNFVSASLSGDPKQPHKWFVGVNYSWGVFNHTAHMKTRSRCGFYLTLVFSSSRTRRGFCKQCPKPHARWGWIWKYLCCSLSFVLVMPVLRNTFKAGSSEWSCRLSSGCVRASCLRLLPSLPALTVFFNTRDV